MCFFLFDICFASLFQLVTLIRIGCLLFFSALLFIIIMIIIMLNVIVVIIIIS